MANAAMKTRSLLIAGALVIAGCGGDDGVVDRDPTDEEARAITALVALTFHSTNSAVSCRASST